MAMVFAGAFPVLEGKSDRVRNFEAEVAPHREEWDRLCAEAGDYDFYNVYLQPGPQGDTAIYVFGLNEPQNARGSFGDSPHDNWWCEYFEDVHGFDLRSIPEGQGGPPPMVFNWEK